MIRAIPRESGRRRPSGSGMVEAAFVLVIFLAFIFLLTDTAWSIFAKVTLQHAVRSGVRYAVTSQTMLSGGKQLGQVASIKQVVKRESMGFLSDSDLGSFVNVTFYSVSSNPPQKVTGATANSAGNLVVVSVDAWQLKPMAPLLHSSAPVTIGVSAGDLIESSGTGGSPPPL